MPQEPVSLATGQRSLADPAIAYPLRPPLTRGCPRTGTADLAYPVEVDYAYDRVPAGLFDQPAGPDLARWAPLLPPLPAPTLGEGGTPLLEACGVYVKDESRNPTWSHKDRLNRVAVSAALTEGAPGVVVASSGNHGASAAAYAARAGLRAIVLASAASPPAVQSFVRAYGADVFSVPVERRWPLMREIVDRLGYHPVSNQTVTHTGHPYGPEGYKTIAYEIFVQLGRPPAAVFAPTGYAELLYGVWKGFAELRRLGVAETAPRMFSCEPAAGGPHARAVASGAPAAIVDLGATDAYAIASPVGGHRGVRAVLDSGGGTVLVTDDELRAAQRDLGREGLWQELSGAAGLAGYRKLGAAFDGPVVCVGTSSGFKDLGVESPRTVEATTFDQVTANLSATPAAGRRG
ncbi:pyridoxal-phosphate dependent enzyme [Nonomuraea sp. MCN248]|uniref:Pyridoxal-phosphate dependent enzyme n=1 Tax=Nonomuraea corallina TaxID=2989783 RepID=A0ABT4SGL9_9ACTN|nr:pyridoxal-phosphate dependent enzyme [Nonomuraea corallina]MDA0636337.1 pyridoxal-phosphate dependent enzyme [Nonomuraea corallina]